MLCPDLLIFSATLMRSRSNGGIALDLHGMTPHPDGMRHAAAMRHRRLSFNLCLLVCIQKWISMRRSAAVLAAPMSRHFLIASFSVYSSQGTKSSFAWRAGKGGCLKRQLHQSPDPRKSKGRSRSNGCPLPVCTASPLIGCCSLFELLHSGSLVHRGRIVAGSPQVLCCTAWSLRCGRP